MRISGGKHKNRRITTSLKGKNKYEGDSPEYRPTAERTRLAIFNIIENSSMIPARMLIGANVADFFCGSGSFGLEALSRGAKHVYFIDSSSEQIELARQNATHMNETKNASFLKAHAPSLPQAPEKCQIVYLDPPYSSKLILESLQSLLKNGWLDEEHVVIIELSRRDEPEIPAEFEIFDIRTYGKTKLLFCALAR